MQLKTSVTRLISDPDTRHHRWQPLNPARTSIPPAYRHWVTMPGSLTKALKARSDQFRVQVLDQSHIYVSLPIEGFTEHSGPCACFSRKVLLMHGNTPWVAAHTLVPESSLRHGLRQLTRLEDKPLGELLFSSSDVRKDHEQVCQTDDSWGRRARYLLHQQPLLVSEFFLPALVDYEQNRALTLY
ncbi:chorismate--pyruvate lyase family protein [Reinekea blandensis]|uniref:Probable chorismate pyruvate-lyase n=1 Tax=Reinekea blandensis MED297 TaxID=314283 RepID=A4BEZ5_9GAMM|nr:chorismate lyase [Reinekea blandensis]EAR09330.1 hypothetical chorismate-pyruvate lyase [Reinekea sp. MED297] [Reinekea blandensis MED297]